jgi:hypothetical protein
VIAYFKSPITGCANQQRNLLDEGAIFETLALLSRRSERALAIPFT